MNSPSATGTAEPAEADKPKRRRLDRANPAPARGRLYYWRSRRGLLHTLIIDPACPWCGEAHTYRAAGLRIAGCNGGYVAIKARRARSTPPKHAGTVGSTTVDNATVDGVNGSTLPIDEPLTCDSSATSPSSEPSITVDANSSRAARIHVEAARGTS